MSTRLVHPSSLLVVIFVLLSGSRSVAEPTSDDPPKKAAAGDFSFIQDRTVRKLAVALKKEGHLTIEDIEEIREINKFVNHNVILFDDQGRAIGKKTISNQELIAAMILLNAVDNLLQKKLGDESKLATYGVIYGEEYLAKHGSTPPKGSEEFNRGQKKIVDAGLDVMGNTAAIEEANKQKTEQAKKRKK